MASHKDCEIVVFPEMFSNGYSSFSADDSSAAAEWVAAAEPLDGSFVRKFQKLAKQYRLAIVVTLLEKTEAKPCNTALLIDQEGEIVLQHRKNHICFFSIPESECTAGTEAGVVSLMTSVGAVRTGILICMDREYPDVMQALVAQDVELVLVPNSCQLIDDPEVGDVRVAGVRAKAFESVVGIAVSNYPAPKHDGHSFAVDGLGRVIAQGDTSETLVVASFPLGELRRLQESEWFRRVDKARGERVNSPPANDPG